MPTGQLPLDLSFRPALDRADFIVGAANREAVLWIDRWPGWPGRGLVIEGPAGAGKSHLACVWQDRSGANAVAGSKLQQDQVPALLHGSANIVVEDADGAPDEPLLHLINACSEYGGHVVLTSRSAPARWPDRLPDLASRLATLPVAAIGMPDDGLLCVVLVKQFAERHLEIGPELIEFLVPRLERSFDAARRIVAAIDRLSLAETRPVTVPLARQALASVASENRS